MKPSTNWGHLKVKIKKQITALKVSDGQNSCFMPLSGTTSIPDLFMWESPTSAGQETHSLSVVFKIKAKIVIWHVPQTPWER